MAHGKNCNVCGGTEFYKSGKCAPCERKKQAIYREENRDAYRKRSIEWRQANPEKAKASTDNWRSRNKERVAQKKKEWDERNSDRVKESAKAGRKKYEEQNPEKVRASKIAYRKRNPELCKLYKHNRRARESGGKLSIGIVDRLFAIQRGKCACCGEALGSDYHLDHIMPLALGGMNEDSNMQLLRAGCNLKKHTKHPVDFMQSRGFLL